MVDEDEAKRILAKINDNLRNAIALYTVYKKGATDGELIAKFDNTYAANAFNVLRTGLLHMVVAALSRIWDKDDDTLSIPRLRKFLGQPDTQAAIILRRRGAMLGLESRPEMLAKYSCEPEVLIGLRKVSEDHAESAAIDARAEIDKCFLMIDQAIADPVVATLRNFRNKVIAHSLEITRDESKAKSKGETISILKYGDERKLIETTIPIAVSLNLLFDDLTVHFDDVRKIWTRYSDEFWSHIH